MRPAPSAPVLPSDAQCGNHPDAPAVALCARCGVFVCARCRHATVASELCDRCHALYVKGKPSREANLALLLATLGFVAVIPGVVALFLAQKELRRVDAARSPLAGRSVAELARVLGIFHLLVLVVLIVIAASRLL